MTPQKPTMSDREISLRIKMVMIECEEYPSMEHVQKFERINDQLLALFTQEMMEIIKVPPCNCKHARSIIAEQRNRLKARTQ